jgi:hypothetical protein
MSALSPTLREKCLGGAVCLIALAAGVATGMWRLAASAEADSLPERRAGVAARSSTEKDHLRQQYKKFTQDLSPEQRQHLRDFHEQLSSADEADALRRTMRGYQDWLRTLSLSERSELMKLSGQPARKADRVEELSPLSPADAAAVEKWLRRLQDWQRRAIERPFFFGDRAADGRRKQPPGGASKPPAQFPFGLNDGHFAELAANLSPLRSAELKRAGSVNDKRRRVTSWLQRRPASSEPRLGPGSPDELVDFYLHDLTDEARKNELVALPVDERNRELREEHRKFQADLRRFFDEDLSADARKRLSAMQPDERDLELRKEYRKARAAKAEAAKAGEAAKASQSTKGKG